MFLFSSGRTSWIRRSSSKLERQDQLGRKVVNRTRKSDRTYMEILELRLRGEMNMGESSEGEEESLGQAMGEEEVGSE